MRKLVALSILILLTAGSALAHGGHVHNIMGTAKSVQATQLVVEKKDGGEMTVVLNDATKYEKGDQAGSRADLVPGVRVSVHLANDSKTAVTVKIAAPK